MRGMVLNIQKFSIDDGPGIRTTVFLKGCTLRCLWCHNPESLDSGYNIQYYPQKCINCGKCVEACPVHAQVFDIEGRTFIRTLCVECGKCAVVCPSNALIVAGKTMTTQEVLAEVEKDRAFYDKSNGGVTFSGGEPMLQIDYLKELLIASKDMGFHTAVDTAGNVPWDNFLEVLPYVDLFIFDLKAIDEVRHRAITGSTNRRILDNLKRISIAGVEIWVRIPVIPGINIVDNEQEKIRAFLVGLKGITSIELLPYHKLGESKYESLQMEYMCKHCLPPDKEFMDNLKDFFKSKGLDVIK